MKLSPEKLELALRRLLALKAPPVLWINLVSYSVNALGTLEVLYHLPFCKAFVYLVLLASWVGMVMPPLDPNNEPLAFVEFFAGRARLSTLANWMGHNSRAHEILWDQPTGMSTHSGMQRRSCFDFNGEAGFMSLATKPFLVFYWGSYVATQWICYWCFSCFLGVSVVLAA